MRIGRHLLASDFDGTMADTSVPSPNGVTVASAYDRVIKEIFGDPGMMVYGAVGGLGNREPRELIDLLIDKSNEMEIRMDNAEMNPADLTELLVDEKLKILIPEISAAWPVLLPGFEHLVSRMLPTISTDLAIVSSGHDPFIRRVFDVHGLEQPRILVTSDTVRGLGLTGVHKPHKFGLRYAIELHRESTGANSPSIFYVGDSDEKDGGMARNAGISYGIVDPTLDTGILINTERQSMRFKGFNEFGQLLESRRRDFVDGSGFRDLFAEGRRVEGQRPTLERR